MIFQCSHFLLQQDLAVCACDYPQSSMSCSACILRSCVGGHRQKVTLRACSHHQFLSSSVARLSNIQNLPFLYGTVLRTTLTQRLFIQGSVLFRACCRFSHIVVSHNLALSISLGECRVRAHFSLYWQIEKWTMLARLASN